jgi:hypothetical protein
MAHLVFFACLTSEALSANHIGEQFLKENIGSTALARVTPNNGASPPILA